MLEVELCGDADVRLARSSSPLPGQILVCCTGQPAINIVQSILEPEATVLPQDLGVQSQPGRS